MTKTNNPHKTLYLIRGLPGSGKSTLAKRLASRVLIEADTWFYDHDGNYKFDPKELPQAHHYCETVTLHAMVHGEPQIAVANTFSQKWEMEPYLRLAEKYNYTVNVIECQNDYGSVHGVPRENIQAMKDRWESIE